MENIFIKRAEVALGTFVTTFGIAAIGYMIAGSQALTPVLKVIGSPIVNSPGLANADAWTSATGAALLLVGGIVMGVAEAGRQMFLDFRSHK